VCYPGQFVTDVRTACPELWENNPWITPLETGTGEVEVIDCDVPLINRCNEAPYHYLHAFVEFLNDRLGLQIKPTLYKGDIHLSDREKSWYSQVRELVGIDSPFWILAAGGKFDVTVKCGAPSVTRRWSTISATAGSLSRWERRGIGILGSREWWISAGRRA